MPSLKPIPRKYSDTPRGQLRIGLYIARKYKWGLRSRARVYKNYLKAVYKEWQERLFTS